MKIKENINYDFVIIGGGFAGMSCAYILAKEGHKVALIEKNIQIYTFILYCIKALNLKIFFSISVCKTTLPYIKML